MEKLGLIWTTEKWPQRKKKTKKKGRSLCPFLLFSPSFLIWGVCLLVQFRTYSQKFRVKFGADITPSTYWNFHSHEWLRMPNIQKQPLTGCHFGKQCCSFVLFSFSFWKTGVVWKIYASRIWKVNTGLKNVSFLLWNVYWKFTAVLCWFVRLWSDLPDKA